MTRPALSDYNEGTFLPKEARYEYPMTKTLKMKLASPLLSASSLETRNKALALIRESLNAH